MENNYDLRDIAITIENFIQFQSIKNGIDELIRIGKTVDIYIPILYNDESGFSDMYDDIYSKIKNKYNVFRKTDNEYKYKILLEPYPMDHLLKIDYEYRLKYKYGLSAKPNPVYKPEWNIFYDGILVNGKYETEFLNVYSKVYIVGNLKYANYEKKDKIGKPILLYLPTYGDVSSIDLLSKEFLKLKEKYIIITKLHHGTSFLTNEKHRINKIREFSDECFDQHTPLVDLLQNASVVLSDNSGAIFEAICAEVPVAIFSEDIKLCKLGEFNSLQYELVKDDIIPYTNDLNFLSNVIEKALLDKYRNKQKGIKSYLFSVENKDLLSNFTYVIEQFLNDNINIKYKNLHNVLSNDYRAKVELINEQKYIIMKKQEEFDNKFQKLQICLNMNKKEMKIKEKNIKQLQNENKELLCSIDEKSKILDVYKYSKLHKIVTFMYKIKNKIFGGKK